MDPNATTVERLAHYVDVGDYEKAEALAALAEYLEDCYHWQVDLYPENHPTTENYDAD